LADGPAREATDEPTALEVRRVERRYDLARSIVPVAWIASLWIPLQGAIPIAEALAGQDTNVTLTVSISIVFSLAVSAGFLALLRRTKEQRDELRRLRRRCNDLETQLELARRN
jgi:hypothetical protein